jgi:hypothetical protein
MLRFRPQQIRPYLSLHFDLFGDPAPDLEAQLIDKKHGGSLVASTSQG